MDDDGQPSARATLVAKALEDPLRLELLYHFHTGETTPAEIARQLGEPLNLVAYHTRMLVRMGCIELVRTERRRGAVAHYYRSVVDPVIEDDDWARLPRRGRRALTLTSLDRIARSARRHALDGGFDLREAHLARSRLVLDAQGVAEVAAALRDSLARTADWEAQSLDRGQATRTFELAVLFFETTSPTQRE